MNLRPLHYILILLVVACTVLIGVVTHSLLLAILAFAAFAVGVISGRFRL